MVEIIPFAGTLTDTGKHRITTVRLRDIVDQLHDQHGLANTRTAEEADLTALGVRGEKVDDLNASDQLLGFR